MDEGNDNNFTAVFSTMHYKHKATLQLSIYMQSYDYLCNTYLKISITN